MNAPVTNARLSLGRRHFYQWSIVARWLFVRFHCVFDKFWLSVVVRQLDWKDLTDVVFTANSLLQSYRSWRKGNQTFASTGDRTRVYRVAGDNSTTEPPMLERSLSVFSLFITNIGISAVNRLSNYKALISFDFRSNSLLQSHCSSKKVNEMVESTCNRTGDYSIAELVLSLNYRSLRALCPLPLWLWQVLILSRFSLVELERFDFPYFQVELFVAKLWVLQKR